jgi:hypothetical protein
MKLEQSAWRVAMAGEALVPVTALSAVSNSTAGVISSSAYRAQLSALQTPLSCNNGLAATRPARAVRTIAERMANFSITSVGWRPGVSERLVDRKLFAKTEQARSELLFKRFSTTANKGKAKGIRVKSLSWIQP